MANHDLYVVQGKTLDNIAGTMRAVLGVDKDAPIRFDEVASSNKTEQINTDIETQADLIAQIQTALEGKAAGGGGTEEIENLIDQSGVLDSTEGTATEKVEYLLRQMRTVLEMKSVTFGVNGSKTTRVDLNCKGIRSLQKAFYNCTELTEVHLTNTQNVVAWGGTFNDNRLITIETLDMSKADKDVIGKSTHNWIRTPTLQNLKIVSETIKNSITFVWCSKLTAESVQSIIDGLDPTATGQTLTLPPTFNNADAEAVVSANIEVVDGVTRIKGKEGWSLVR